MKHKTAELDGALLDAAVAKAEGFDIQADEGFSPSISWAEGGPIIERERIEVVPSPSALAGWQAWAVPAGATRRAYVDGPTPLIAAMRAFVASKFGDEVEL